MPSASRVGKWWRRQVVGAMLLILIVLVVHIAITVDVVMVMALTVVLVMVTLVMAHAVILRYPNDAGDAADTDCGGGTCRSRG